MAISWLPFWLKVIAIQPSNRPTEFAPWQTMVLAVLARLAIGSSAKAPQAGARRLPCRLVVLARLAMGCLGSSPKLSAQAPQFLALMVPARLAMGSPRQRASPKAPQALLVRRLAVGSPQAQLACRAKKQASNQPNKHTTVAIFARAIEPVCECERMAYLRS